MQGLGFELHFNEQSKACLDRAMQNLNTIDMLFQPYYSLDAHLKTFLHPFCHIIQFVLDVFYAFAVLTILMATLLIGPYERLKDLRAQLYNFSYAACLEMVNMNLAVLSFATRLFTTLVNLGYISIWALAEEDISKNLRFDTIEGEHLMHEVDKDWNALRFV